MTTVTISHKRVLYLLEQQLANNKNNQLTFNQEKDILLEILKIKTQIAFESYCENYGLKFTNNDFNKIIMDVKPYLNNLMHKLEHKNDHDTKTHKRRHISKRRKIPQ